jgi:hypothetical protein
MRQTNYVDDRPIKSTGKYNIDVDFNDFEIQDNFKSEDVASTDTSQLKNVVAWYNQILDQTEKIIVDKQIEKESRMVEEYYEEKKQQKERVGSLKDQLRDQLGQTKYNELYALLRKHRSNPHC